MGARKRGVRISPRVRVVHVPLPSEPGWCIELPHALALDPFAAFVITTEEPELVRDPHWRALLKQHLDHAARAAKRGRPRLLARIRAVAQHGTVATLRQMVDAEVHALADSVRQRVLWLALRGAGRRPSSDAFRLHDTVRACQRGLPEVGPAATLGTRATSPLSLRPIGSPPMEQPLKNALIDVATSEALVTGKATGVAERKGEWSRVWQTVRRIRDRVDVEMPHLRVECGTHRGLLAGLSDAERWIGLPMPTPRDFARATTISFRWRIGRRSPVWP